MNNYDREETRSPLIMTIPACSFVVALHPDWHGPGSYLPIFGRCKQRYLFSGEGRVASPRRPPSRAERSSG
jgi:hypothetical protein